MKLDKTSSTTTKRSQPPPLNARPPKLGDNTSYYVVSKKKFFALFFASFSLYIIYWCYQNWSLWKQRTDADIWAGPRALFNIFFIHSLFAKIHTDAIQASDTDLPKLQIAATIFVIAQVAMNVINNVIPEENVALGTIAILVGVAISAWCVWQAQEQANIASLDTAGQSNSQFSTQNYILVVFGGLLWFLAIIGVLLG